MTQSPGWEVRRVEPHTPPTDPPDGGWLAAVVPGSVAASPAVTSRYGPEVAHTADAYGWSLRTTTHAAPGSYDLIWSDVATYATFRVDDRQIATSDNAFGAGRVPVGHLDAGEHELRVDIAPLHERAVPTRPRPRWHSSLVPDRSLRRRRTPLLGRIPTWAGAAPPVGILGRCELVPSGLPHVAAIDARDCGTVTIRVTGASGPPRVRVDDDDTRVTWAPTADGGVATVRVDEPRLWWPHTHGDPVTYRLTVSYDDRPVAARTIGFSSITADRSHGRFGLDVNGVPVFVRGACWVPPDPIGWHDAPGVLRRDLERLAATGINLVRVTGTNRYESDVFHDLAAQLGLLVWQDVMLATFDPPADAEWLTDLDGEFRCQLTRLQARPHVAVVCGGTETLQQPTLLGRDPATTHIAAVHDVLPRVAGQLLPHVPLVESSPSGGALPVSLDHGVSHYFGVGAYERSLDDAVTARVSFASEALAFSIPPERASVRETFGDVADVTSIDAWRDAIPGDRGVDWTFADTTAHYVARLFGVGPSDVAHDRWLDLQRAAVSHAMTTVFAAWRSDDTPTRGGIVLSHRDLADGPGWGLIDHRGRPKAPLLALTPTLAPRAVVAVDRGLDGLALWLVNDTAESACGTVHLDAFTDIAAPAAHAVRDVVVPARTTMFVHVEHALGGFRDLTWAWRFGPPYYRFLRALWQVDGEVAAEAVVPLGPLDRLVTPSTAPVEATHTVRDGVLRVTVRSASPQAFVHLDAPGWVARNGWTHLTPGRSLALVADPDAGDSRDRDMIVVRSLTADPAVSASC